MKIGYVRVSTQEQNEGRQTEAFNNMGVDKLFIDKQSGKNINRPQLAEMLAYIREGDIVVVESISRLARNTRDLLDIVEKIKNKGASFVSLKESIDTDSVSGNFMLTIFAAMAELERGYILEKVGTLAWFDAITGNSGLDNHSCLGNITPHDRDTQPWI